MEWIKFYFEHISERVVIWIKNRHETISITPQCIAIY